MNGRKRIPLLILFIYILVLIIFHISGYIGHYGFDDLHYAQLAVNLNNGIVNFDDHFTYRFPVVVLTALSYKIFGVSDFASAVPPLFITICILLIVYLILKSEKIITLIIGLSLTLFSNWFIFYSDKLMPDIYVAFSVIISLYIIQKYKYHSSKKHPFLYSILLSIALLFGFMAKGTIVLIVPLLIYFVVIDLILKRDTKFWSYTIVTGIVTLLAYFVLIWLLTGDVAKRFEAIASNSYLSHCSYDQQPLKILVERITYGFLKLITYHGMFIGFVFVFVRITEKNVKKHFQFNHPNSFFFVAATILFLSSNFMTVSFTSYSPMCLDPRHYLFLVPVVAIAASQVITKFAESRKFAIPIIIVLTIVTIWSYFLPGKTFYIHYLPLTLLFFVYYVLGKKINSPKIFTIAFVLILTMIPLEWVKYAGAIQYKKQKEIVTKQILEKYDNCLVITDDVQYRLGNYYKIFNKDYNATFINFDDYENQPPLNFDKKLLLLNWYTRYLSKTDDEDLPYYARNINPENTLVYENKKLNISIYELNNTFVPEINGTGLLHSFNGFEQSVVNWEVNTNDVSETIIYEGKKSARVNEYSATFVYPLDSLPINNFDKIIISCNLFCNYQDKTNSSLIISIEKEETGSYIYKGLKIDKQIKAYSNWWPVSFEIEAKTTELKPSSMLKVYLWKMDNNTLFIDNFDVKIIGMNE